MQFEHLQGCLAGEPRSLAVRALFESGTGSGFSRRSSLRLPSSEARWCRCYPWAIRAGSIAVVWPASRHLASRVRAFVDLAHTLFEAGKGSSGRQ